MKSMGRMRCVLLAVIFLQALPDARAGDVMLAYDCGSFDGSTRVSIYYRDGKFLDVAVVTDERDAPYVIAKLLGPNATTIGHSNFDIDIYGAPPHQHFRLKGDGIVNEDLTENAELTLTEDQSENPILVRCQLF